VSQPKPCKPIGAEFAAGAKTASPALAALLDMRTKMRVGKILRGCGRVGKEPEVRRVRACGLMMVMQHLD
jgi:hypothetical protein